MRTLLLTTTLLLASPPAFCTLSCAVASASAEAAAPPTILALQPEGLALSSGSQAAPLEPDRISRVPALRRIASNGAQLFDLGTQHGIQAVFARNGSTFQVFYLAPDGQAAIGGVMWDAAGHNVTRDQVAPIDGTIPTVTISTPAPAAPAVAPTPVAASAPAFSALKVAEGTTFGSVGVASAPRLYVFIDPLCAFSVRAMDQLRPYVAAGKLQLAVIPLSEIDYETHGQSTVAAKSLLSLPAEQIVTACQWPLNSGSPALCVLLLRGHAAWRTRARRSGKPARPYMVRFSILSRLIWPSAGLVVQGRSRAACTAARSRRMLAANSASGVPAASASAASRLSWFLRRNRRLSRFATAMPLARSGACCRRAETKACSAPGSVSMSAMSRRASGLRH